MVPTLGASARCYAGGPKPTAQAVEFVEVPKQDRIVGSGWCGVGGGICFVYPSVLCSWELLEDGEASSPPPSFVSPCTPCPPRCPEHPSGCCELLACGNSNTGGGVAPKA